MNLLKFLFGIIIVQIATYLLILLAPAELNMTGFLRLGVPLLIIALVVAFWFSSIAGHHSKDAIDKVKDKFANERDKLRLNAQRAKERVIKEAHKNITKETQKAHAKANFKVGAAFAAALGVGALFIFAQMVTAGLLAITATGGVMGGYYWRGRRLENQRLKVIENSKDINVIESKPSEINFLKEDKS
jgi:Flp pilus assembly protein TadB